MRRLGIAGLLLGLLVGCGQSAEPSNDSAGFVQTLAAGGWTGPKFINTTYPGEVRDIAVDSSGGIFALVAIQGNNATLPYLVKYSASGTLEWSHRAPNDLLSGINKLEVDAQGNGYLMSRYETKLVKDTLCSDSKVDFSGPQAISILKYNPQGTLQWSKNLCGQRIYSEAFVPSSSGGVFVSLFVQGAKGFCYDTSAEGVLVSLSSLGSISWCRSLGAGQPAPLTLDVTDSSGNVYVLGSETFTVNDQVQFLASIFSFDPNGNLLWQGGVGGLQTTFGPRFLGSLDGIDSTGELLLTDPEGRIVRMGSSSGQIHSSYQPLYQECAINMNADSGTGRFIGLNDRIFAYGTLGDGANDYHYLAECDAIGQVKNIRRWSRPSTGSTTGVNLTVIRANRSDSVFIAGSSRLAGSQSSSYFAFLQKLNPDLSN